MKRYVPEMMNAHEDALLERTTDPHHRAILRNYRRHALFEVTGNWKRILAPEMTVAQPLYRVTQLGTTTELNGYDAVAAFYSSLTERELAAFFGPIDINVVVADWGIASHGLWGIQMPGQALVAEGEDVDPDRHYNVTYNQAMIWYYTDDARLIGEHIWKETSLRTIEPLDDADVFTLEQAAAVLEPMLERNLAESDD